MPSHIRFIQHLSDGSTYRIGTAVKYTAGWKFLSNTSSHRSSRKFHPTMEACVPSWAKARPNVTRESLDLESINV